jgi:hypothetical protein
MLRMAETERIGVIYFQCIKGQCSSFVANGFTFKLKLGKMLSPIYVKKIISKVKF